MSGGIATDAANPDIPSSVVQEFYPTIPELFPTERLPKNFCQKELLKLFRCSFYHGLAMECQEEYSAYSHCRRTRDVKIYAEIKDWETGQCKKLTFDERTKYNQKLKDKLQKIENEFERIPYSASFSNKMWRFSSEIEQLKWRIDYIAKMDNLEKKKA